MSRSSISDATDADADAASSATASPLPASYREALDGLLRPNDGEDNVDGANANNTPSSPKRRPPTLSSLSDASILELAKELRSNLYATRDEWGTAGDWGKREAELYRLGGDGDDGGIGSGKAALVGAAGARQVMAGAVGDYLGTFVEAMEYRLAVAAGGKGGSVRVPELLAKKRRVKKAIDDDGEKEEEACEVYGPVAVSSLLPGNTFEVWTTAAPTDDDEVVGGEAAAADDDGNDDSDEVGKVSVVLGAGNQSFLSLVDVLDNVLRRRMPVLMKHHPLRPWLSGPYGVILGPLARRGYFSHVLDVDVEVTKALLSDRAIGHVHITGALKTAEAVRETLRGARPDLSPERIKSMITSELGCATPQIFDDGIYTEKEIQHAAQIVAFGKKGNGGCNCLAAQVVVLPKRWAQKGVFREKLLEELKRQPTTPCYYPGSKERSAGIIKKCREMGSECTMVKAVAVSEDVKVSDDDQVVVVECGTPGEEGYNSEPLLVEAFGPVLAIVELDGEGDNDYLADTVVPFLNDKDNIFGSLSCSVFTPVSKGGPEDRDALRTALSGLRYGTACINQSCTFGYLAMTKGGMWGGHSLEGRGQSGNGNVGDQYGIAGGGLLGAGDNRSRRATRVVVYGPSLEGKPVFDLAVMPPPIVLDALTVISCAPNMLVGMTGALGMVATRAVYGIASYAGIWLHSSLGVVRGFITSPEGKNASA